MRRWIIVLVVFALAVSALFGVLQLSNARTFQVFGDLVARVETNRAVVALTFDDGPTTNYTQPVLEILEAHDVKATFFLTGGPPIPGDHRIGLAGLDLAESIAVAVGESRSMSLRPDGATMIDTSSMIPSQVADAILAAAEPKFS